ncbi:MAG TPA: hypothetical protein VK465_07025 [Fibrobacteria bacterium]|nr:hypothetical protein [Fibrobacteria bacterium]
MNSAEDYSWHPILRSILHHWVWKDKPFSKGQAWIDLILLAHHNPCKKLISGVLVPMEEGQLAWPKYLLAERWGWSRDKVERFLKTLEADAMIRQQTSQLTTIITLLNYKELRRLAFGKQGNEPDNGQDNGQGNAQVNDKTTHESQYKKKELKKEEIERDPAREASMFRPPVRSEEAVALAVQARLQQGETQADHDRAIAVLAIYPDIASSNNRPVAKGIPAINLLIPRIVKNRDYAWEEHAQLERDLNPSPVDAHKWAAGMPDPYALAGLRAASKAKETSNGQAANPGRSQRSPGGPAEGLGPRQAPAHAKAAREFPERLAL